MKTKLAIVCLVLLPLTALAADRPPKWRPLLDPQLSKFDIYLSYRGDQTMSVIHGKADLKHVGLNPPDQDVFTIVEGLRHPLSQQR